MTSSTSYEGGTGGDCWETGDEEFTVNSAIWDNVNASPTNSNCRTCTANGNCTNNTNGPTRNGTGDPSTLYFSMSGWEDDTGDRCLYEYQGEFLTNEDDCFCSANSNVLLTSIAEGVSQNTALGCGGDHSITITWSWQFVPVLSPPAPGFTAGCANFYLPAMASTQSHVTWYWQGANASGTSTAAPAALSNYPISTPGTYYVRARGDRNNLWSTATGITITASQLNDILDADGDGFTICAGDCNDGNASVYPGAPEILCDGIDNNCNGMADEDTDFDGDGISVCAGDCDDSNPAVYPGATEIWCNGIDENCDGVDDADADGDGHSICGGDCDDNNPSVYPGAPEIQCDGIDNNCNGNIDEDQDLDGDGVSVCNGDCNDADSTVYPGAPDLCDGISNDCGAQKAHLAIAGDSWAQFMADDDVHNKLFNMYGLGDRHAISKTFETEILCSPSPGPDDYAVSGSEAREWADEANFDYLQNLIDALNAAPGVDMVVLSIGGNDILAGRSDGGWYKDMDLDNPGSEAALFDQVENHTWYIMQQVWARARPNIKFVISSYDYPNFNVDPVWCWAYACDKREDLSRDANGNGSIDNGELLTDAELSDLMLLVESRRGAMADADPRVFYDNSMGLMQYYYGYDDGLYPNLAEGSVPFPQAATPYAAGGNPSYPSDRDNFRLVGICGFPGLFSADPIHLDAEGYEYKVKNQFDNILFEHYRGTPDAVIWSEPANDGYVDAIGGSVNSSGIRVGDTGPSCCSGPATADYRGILSFNTSAIPDDAVVTSASIYLMRSSANDNPFNHSDRSPVLDIVDGHFGTSEALEASDATAPASMTDIGCFKGNAESDHFALRIDVNIAALPFINKAGKTQFRISFDYSDWSPEYINFYDGDGSTARMAAPDDKPVFREKVVRKMTDAAGNETEILISQTGEIEREPGYVYTEKLRKTELAPDGSVLEYYTVQRAIEHTGLAHWMLLHYGAPGNGSAPFIDISYRSDSPQDPLPVELVQFTATGLDDQVLLEWTTSSEVNSDRFEVQHSVDAHAWQAIGSVPGQGFSAAPSDYDLLHERPVTGVNYYRLKMIDRDETFEYSRIVSVEFDAADTRALLSAYPNPFRDGFLLELEAAAGKAGIRITDLLHRTVYSDERDLQAGHNLLPVDGLSSLPAGVYIATVSIGSGSYSVRIVKD